MEKSPKARPKKHYFTKSQALLPSIHPTQEFLSIIQLKKHYQSLIKQQLNSLNLIQNAQNQEIALWQHQIQKQVKVSLFEAKEAQQPKSIQKIEKVQKPSQEFINCYERLRLVKMQKSFIRMKERLVLQREKGVKKRAASYLSCQNASQKWFSVWKDQTKQALTEAKNVKLKQTKLSGYLKNLFWARIFGQIKFLLRIARMKKIFNINKKTTFINKISMAASLRFQKIGYKSAFEQLKKKVGCRIIKFYLYQKKKADEVKMKCKLLKNIFCHRKFNIFFNGCKQKIFKKEQAKITHQIIHKIDVLQLISKSSQVSSKSQHSQTQKIISLNQLQKETLNIPLLNLILQNFVQEYSQEFSANFNQCQLMFLLQELKAQCISELLYKRNCQHFVNALAFCSNKQKFESNMGLLAAQSFFQKLCLYNSISTSLQILKGFLKKSTIKSFFAAVQSNQAIKRKVNQLEHGKHLFKFQAKNLLNSLRENLSSKQIVKFNNDIAVNWRQIQIYKKAFNRLFEYKLMKKAQHEPDLSKKEEFQDKELYQTIEHNQENDYYQLMVETVIKVQNQEKEIEQRGHEVGQQSEKITKTKLQLSKIVSAISKNMGSKLPFDSYSKSIQSPDSNHKFPLRRLKTQSANRHQQNDYSPRLSQLKNIYKKQCLQQEILRQCERKADKLINRMREIRLATALKNMQKQRVFRINKKKLAFDYFLKFFDLFRNHFKRIRRERASRTMIIASRNKKVFQDYRLNCNQNTIVKKNSLALGQKLKGRYFQSFFQRIRQRRQFIAKKLSLNQLLFISVTKFGSQSLLKAIYISLVKKTEHQNVEKIITLRINKFKEEFCRKLHYSLKKRELRWFIYKLQWQKLKLSINKQKKNSKKKKFEVFQKESSQNQNLAKYLQQSPNEQKIIFQFQLSQNLFENHLYSHSTQKEMKHELKQRGQLNEQGVINEQASKYQLNKSENQDDQSNNRVQQGQKQNNQFQQPNQFQNSSGSQQSLSQEQIDLLQLVKQQKKSLKYQNLLASSNKKPEIQQRQVFGQENLRKKHAEIVEKQEFKINSFQQLQDQSQLDQQMCLNRLKQYLFRQKCSYFFKGMSQKQLRQTKKIEKDLDRSIQSSQPLYQMCRKSLSKNYMLRWLDRHREDEQRIIKKGELQGIVQYQLFKRQKELKKSIFKAFSASLQTRKSTELVRKCFAGWLLFSRQKKTLKQYLNLQAKSKNQALSFFPNSLQQKQQFQYLQQQ